MTGNFTIRTVKFPLVNESHPKPKVSVNYPQKGKEQLQIDLTALFSHVSCIHNEEVDLLILK